MLYCAATTISPLKRLREINATLQFKLLSHKEQLLWPVFTRTGFESLLKNTCILSLKEGNEFVRVHQGKRSTFMLSRRMRICWENAGQHGAMITLQHEWMKEETSQMNDYKDKEDVVEPLVTRKACKFFYTALLYFLLCQALFCPVCSSWRTTLCCSF